MIAHPFLRPALVLGLLTLLSACVEEEAPEAEQARPVRTITVAEQLTGETVSVAGTVESQVQADLGSRTGGRLIERLVSVGDTVTDGQVLARLDPADEENGLRAAEARRVPGVPIVAPLDLQANVSDRMRHATDLPVAYSTHPHTGPAARGRGATPRWQG